jgi:hypothetical protein
MRSPAGVFMNRMQLRSGFVPALALVAAAGVTGCSGSDSLPSLKVYEVKGRVVLANGQPLSGGFISFVPKGDLSITPSGVIGPDGTFSLVTGGSGEGAPPGDYKVRVEAPEFQQSDRKSRRRPLIPPKYSDEDSSDIVITVRAESNHLDPILLK